MASWPPVSGLTFELAMKRQVVLEGSVQPFLVICLPFERNKFLNRKHHIRACQEPLLSMRELLARFVFSPKVDSN